jgi:hypothetical protein
MKDRKPRTIVMLIELEDNCGAVLAKAKKEIAVELNNDRPQGVPELDEVAVRGIFADFVTKLPNKIKI